MEGVLKQVLGQVFLADATEEQALEWEREEIFAQLEEVRAHIRCAESCFASVADEDLIEASIYEMASLKARYNHLLKVARQKELVRPLS